MQMARFAIPTVRLRSEWHGDVQYVSVQYVSVQYVSVQRISELTVHI